MILVTDVGTTRNLALPVRVIQALQVIQVHRVIQVQVNRVVPNQVVVAPNRAVPVLAAQVKGKEKVAKAEGAWSMLKVLPIKISKSVLCSQSYRFENWNVGSCKSTTPIEIAVDCRDQKIFKIFLLRNFI